MTGLVVIVLFLSPAVSFLTGKATVKFELNHDSYENQKKEILQEIEVVSEKSEESILQQYKEQIENQIKEMCREEQLDCAAEVSISQEAQIEQITIRIKDGKPVPSYLVGEIAALYQIKEDDIWIEGA